MLVGASKTATWTVANAGTSSKSGMKGDFPAGSGEFGPTSTKALTTANGGWLRQGFNGSQTYTYTPTARGADTLSRTLTADIGNTNSSASITFSGKGVAPVASRDAAGLAAGLVRLGTSKPLTLQISNLGDGNLAGAGLGNLVGSVPSSSDAFVGAGGSFSLADNGSKSFAFTFTPDSRTPQEKSLTLSFSNGKPDGTNLSNTMAAQLSGAGVGPVAQSTGDVAGVLDLGTLPADFVMSRALTIRNASADTGAASALTDLTLLSSAITGPSAAAVSTPDFLAGRVLAEQESAPLDVRIHPTSLGAFSATLTLLTDQDAPKGTAGTPLVFSIIGTVAMGGDANGDNIVDMLDYHRIDQAFIGGTPAPGWAGGDFDGSGGVNGDDYFIIDRGFLGGAPVGASSPVPEPSSLGLCLMGAALLRRRRS